MAKNRKKSSSVKRGREAPTRVPRPREAIEKDRGGDPSLPDHVRGRAEVDVGGAVSADAALPLLHRVAIVYLLLPVFIWLVGWFEWWVGLPAVVLLGAGLRPALAGPWRMTAPQPATVALLLLAAGWTLLTAAGGVFDGNNSDWLDHRALLLDLSRSPWPVFLADDLADYLPGAAEEPALLRYYLGWFLVPGLIGRLAGPAALNWAVPLWTGVGVALVLLLFVGDRRGGRALLAAGIFVFFSGMDVLRVLLVEDVGLWDFWIDRKGWPAIGVSIWHVEFFGLWDVRNQNTSHMSAFMWTPQHLLCAGLFTLLLLHLRRRPRFLAVSGVVLAAAPFWSAFVAVGLLPLVAILMWNNGPRPFLRWPNLCLAVPLAGLIALYLTAGSLDFPTGWLWEIHDWSRLAQWAPVFYLSEFLTPALLLLALRPGVRREPCFAVSVATLLLLPWYSFSEFNDLQMRASMPALLVLCTYCADAVVGQNPDRGGALASRGRPARLAYVGLVAVLAVGVLNPFVELARATRVDVPFRYEASGFTTLTMPLLRQRENLAPEVPGVLRRLLRDAGERSADTPPEPGAPVVRAGFDVYVRDRKLIYVKERCRPDVAETIRVEFVPADPDTNADLLHPVETRRVGTGCGAMAGLPGYAVAAVRTGQLERDGGDWAVELVLDAAGRVTEVRR